MKLSSYVFQEVVVLLHKEVGLYKKKEIKMELYMDLRDSFCPVITSLKVL